MCMSWLISFAWISSSCKERKRDLQNEKFFLPTARLEVTTFGFRGLAVKAMASESKGRDFRVSLWARRIFHYVNCFRSLQLEEIHANEINHDRHLANTLFQIKVR